MWTPSEVSALRSRAHQADTAKASGLLDVVLGSELLSRTITLSTPTAFETGCKSLDTLLQGRIRPGLVSLAGQDNIIVTILSLYISISYLIQFQGHLSIVDTTGLFDVVRLLGVVRHQLGKDSMIEKKVSAEEIAVLDQVHISRAFDAEGLEQTMLELENQLGKMDLANHMIPPMVVVGNVTSVFSSEFVRNKVQGRARFEKFCLRLRKLAIQHQVVFLLVSTITEPVSHEDPTILPPLGRSYADLVDVSLTISDPERSSSSSGKDRESIYAVTLQEDRSLVDGATEAIFRIRDGSRLEALS